jgi:membrane-associated phospholipid phosphatase
MELLYEMEIAFILFVQSLGDWLTTPMGLISLIGNEEFYLLIMPALYWCFDAVLGIRMGVMLLLTNGINSVFKLAFHTPRPYWYDTRVLALSTETTFGMPSGHSQNAASLWGLMAASLRGRGVTAFFIVLIIMIGISRIYLGVHFVRDVLLGWLVGGILLWSFLKLEKPVWARVRTLSLQKMLSLALVSSLLLMALILITAASLGDWETPREWSANALAASGGTEIDPLDLSGAFTVSGTWLGLLAGAAWLYHRQGGFDASGGPGQRVLRYFIGLLGILVFWYWLGSVFPRDTDALSFGLRYFRYFLIGLWISALAPLIFKRLNLSTSKTGQVPSLSTDKNLL